MPLTEKVPELRRRHAVLIMDFAPKKEEEKKEDYLKEG